MLGLHLAESVLVGEGYGVEVARAIGDVRLGRHRPLFEPAQDLRLFVVERRYASVIRAAAHEPGLAVSLREIAGETAHGGEILIRLLGVAFRTECRHVSHDAIATQGHTHRHGIAPCQPGITASGARARCRRRRK